MPKKKKQPGDVAAGLANEVETLTQSEAERGLEATRERICEKAKQVAQQKEARKDVVSGYNETIKVLSEELETELLRKGLLEDHLRRLEAGHA